MTALNEGSFSWWRSGSEVATMEPALERREYPNMNTLQRWTEQPQ